MHHARVLVAQRAPERPSIRVAAGDPVTLGERDSDWPQYVWTTLAQGLGGWIPATLFDRQVGEGTTLADYDTRELATEIVELISVHREQEGWWSAENSRGKSRWITAHGIELIENESASL